MGRILSRIMLSGRFFSPVWRPLEGNRGGSSERSAHPHYPEIILGHGL